MDHENNNNASTAKSDRRTVRDGLVDFSTYSTQQLQDLQYRIDRDSHPQDYSNLLRELEQRTAPQAEPVAADHELPVRFTSFGGMIGWLEATSRRLTLFGAGVVRFEADEVVLRGWQRTWLGIAVSNEIRVDVRNVRNAVHDGAWVSFEVHPDSGFVQRLRFRCSSADSAVAILERLPVLHTAEFEAHWTRLRNFNESTRLATPVIWVTPVLVAMNILVFAAMAITGRSVWALDPQLFVRWGANAGPLTINGEWWRLLAAIFLHGDIVHLLVNMWVLWSVGRLVERLYGNAAFALIYFAAGIVGSVTSIVWDPLRNTVGASGAIFGVLGALLAFLAHRHTQVPGRLVRAHGPSTLVFVVASLVSGFNATGVDNAAHVGGLLGGLLFGWMLARPLEPDERLVRRLRTTVAGVAIAGFAVVLATWQLRSLHAGQSAPERYWNDHKWLIEGQLKVQQVMANMQYLGNAGTLSEAGVLHLMETQVKPFWESADKRLLEEPESDDPAVQAFAEQVTDYVRWRTDAIVAGVEGTKDNDTARLADAQVLSQRADRKLARINRLELKGIVQRQALLARAVFARKMMRLLPGHAEECVKSQMTQQSEDPRGSPTDGATARVAAGCAAQNALKSGDYAALDAMLHPKDLNDLDDGGSSLTGVIGGLRDLFEPEPDPRGTLALLAEWRKKHPESNGPDLVEAMLFSSWAWAARGHGVTTTVSPQGWMLYTQRSEMAAAALEDADTPERGPLWYQLRLSGMVEQNEDKIDFGNLFGEAVEKYPQYYPIYSQMLRHLMPRWHGSYAQVEEFIDNVFKLTADEQGREMYTRLYWTYADMEGDETNLFVDTEAQWPAMRSGFEELMSRHPRSYSIRNHYGFFACQARDPEAYLIARKMIEGFELRSVWTGKFTLEECDRWASMPDSAR